LAASANFGGNLLGGVAEAAANIQYLSAARDRPTRHAGMAVDGQACGDDLTEAGKFVEEERVPGFDSLGVGCTHDDPPNLSSADGVGGLRLALSHRVELLLHEFHLLAQR